jgi:hypothetical protein
MTRKTPFATLAAVAAVAAGGCGGEDLSVDEYRTQANQLCAISERQASEVPPPQSPEDIGPSLEAALELAEEQQAEFERLEPPDELAEQHEEAVAQGDEQIETVEGFTDELEDGDDPAEIFAEQIPQLNEQIERSNALAAEIGGLEECVTEPIPVPGQEPS